MRSDPRSPRRHGPLPVERVHLRPTFYSAIITAQFADGTPMPMALIAKDCGFRHPQRLSNLIRSSSGVPITTRLNFERVARLIRFPATQIFVEPVDAAPRLVKRANADEVCA